MRPESCFTSEWKPADAGRSAAGASLGSVGPGCVCARAARRQVSNWTDSAAWRTTIRPVSGTHGVGRRDSTASEHARGGSSLDLTPLVQDRGDLFAHAVAGGSAVNS